MTCSICNKKDIPNVPTLCVWSESTMTRHRWTGSSLDARFDNPLNWDPHGVPQSPHEIVCEDVSSKGAYVFNDDKVQYQNREGSQDAAEGA